MQTFLKRDQKGRLAGTHTAEDRFTEQVFRTPACWLFQGLLLDTGYGQFKVKGKRYGAHQYAWIIWRGEIPKGQCVLHKCDNPRCVNPDHLFLGTRTENRADCIAKGRQAKGTKISGAKLNSAKTEQIRRRYKKRGKETLAVLAREFGVSTSTVWDCLHGRTWK